MVKAHHSHTVTLLHHSKWKDHSMKDFQRSHTERNRWAMGGDLFPVAFVLCPNHFLFAWLTNQLNWKPHGNQGNSPETTKYHIQNQLPQTQALTWVYKECSPWLRRFQLWAPPLAAPFSFCGILAELNFLWVLSLLSPSHSPGPNQQKGPWLVQVGGRPACKTNSLLSGNGFL